MAQRGIMAEDFTEELELAEQIAGYRFRDRQLLLQALTHSSFANDRTGNPSNGNERLEFLGDAVLDAVIAEKLFRLLPRSREGNLTTLKSAVVDETSLAAVSRRTGLNRCLLLGNGEEKLGGRNKDSIISDGIEAIIGAVYLDGGRPEAEAVVLRLLDSTLQDAMAGKLFKDYKTALQEKFFAQNIRDIDYRDAGSSGPDHEKTYTVELYVEGNYMGRGTGRKIKLAEQAAAADALKKLSEEKTGTDGSVFPGAEPSPLTDIS